MINIFRDYIIVSHFFYSHQSLMSILISLQHTTILLITASLAAAHWQLMKFDLHFAQN